MSNPHGGSPAASATYPCGGCGARLEFSPGTNVLQCPYCGFRQEIQASGQQIREIAIEELGSLPRKPVGQLAPYTLVCQRCSAQTQTTATAGLCQFCGSPLVLDPNATGQIIPEGVLPFAVDHNGIRTSLGKWVSSRWFAPNSFKKVVNAESTKGTYVPHWTYDSATFSHYRGQRGVHYYVTTRDSNGNTRTERRTRWYNVSGQVSRAFDDVLVPASMALPVDKVDDLAPWPLPEAQPFQQQYLAGYYALRYDVEPENGLGEAKSRMSKVINEDCRRDIGGDAQRVDHVNTNFTNVTFKLMLLPIWVATYMYAGKSWQILINGRTGEIQGERPWSKVKIALAVVAALIALVVLFLVFRKH
ncbi:hypothetical protein OU415_23515 [Saccharopolyspora sp. WRP15-2]|uniref:Uncharacterized protein n=1 Tax=Saccharopolyspora oryzae TaxID=2997343 RepID=A0ABT4V371_9PSEU|nr:hypothetical protein [Saccharopolyspora oryzae]MDA3628421.1 hypothetical protein [Saccharopolyspora oryzae]